MSVEQKREQVLEKIYDELLEGDLDEFMPNAYSAADSDGRKTPKQVPVVQLIVALENAKANDEEVAVKQDALEFDNAHHEIDRQHNDRNELVKVLATAAVNIAINVAWGMIFVHELKATRKFEIDGTEVSAAGRWLKQSFPKMRML